MEKIISEIINIQIIPVILLPVTGLVSLAFYNRASAIHTRLRQFQKEMRDLMIEENVSQTPRTQDVIELLHGEIKFLHTRFNLNIVSLLCFLLAIGLFCMCALFIALGLFFSWAIQAGLVFWFIGPVLICIGIISGILELIFSLRSQSMQSLLIEKWESKE